MNILITGATGFIGNELVYYLQNKKFNVLGLSHTRNSKLIKKISLNNYKALNKFISQHNFDIVIHLASMIKNDSPMKMYNSNCKTTINLLESCVQNGVKKFIFTSSHAVYGKSSYLPIDESHPTHPNTNYGITKLICEQIIRMYSISYNIQTINLRLTSIYGINQPKTTMIPKLILSAFENKKINLDCYANGFQVMDLLHVKDVCKAIECVCNSLNPSKVYNIASGYPITIDKIAKNISKLTKKNFYDVKKINSDTNHFFYDISKSKKELHFSPEYKLNYKMLKILIQNFR